MTRIHLRHGVAAGALAVAALMGVPRIVPISTAFAAETVERDPGIIVSQAEFQELAKLGGVKIVDVRSAKDYERGHVPGAVSLPWVKLNIAEDDGVRNELASDAELAKQFGLAGLSYDDTILIYDATTLAGRAYIPFDYAGFSKVHVLDGGIGSWTGALTKAAANPTATSFALARKRENRVLKDFVASRIGTPDVVIVDGRTTQAFEDGHIPSSKVFPSEAYVGKGSFRRDRKELLADLASRGITPNRKVVSYCGSGVAAAHAYLVLKDLGFQDVVLYDGSWDEWSRDPKAGQEVSLPNYSFASIAGTDPSSGPSLLSEAQVKELQKQPDVVVLDVRSPADFAPGRIPGSVNVYWNDTLDKDRVLKSREELQALYRAKGVTPEKRVIVFTRGGLQLAHTYTVLKLLGYPKVDVFNGKWEGWLNPAFSSTL